MLAFGFPSVLCYHAVALATLFPHTADVLHFGTRHADSTPSVPLPLYHAPDVSYTFLGTFLCLHYVFPMSVRLSNAPTFAWATPLLTALETRRRAKGLIRRLRRCFAASRSIVARPAVLLPQTEWVKHILHLLMVCRFQ